MRSYLTFSIAVMLPLLAGAQNPPTASPPTTASPAASSAPASTPAKSIGLYAYPKNNQSSDQQLKDENDCYASAKQNSGVDPQAAGPGSSNCGTATGRATAGCTTGRKRRTEGRCGEGFCKGCSRRRSSRRHHRRCRDWCCCWCDCRRNGRAPLEEESQEGLRAAGSATNSSSSAAGSG